MDFRPIPDVGCLFKILSKILANRLIKVIGVVVSQSQPAFVKGRQILDGILIANEIVDDAHATKKELLIFHVDFEKAYDSMNWMYLEDVMIKMHFFTLWRKWFLECVTRATTLVLVNEIPAEEFKLERGISQGDP